MAADKIKVKEYLRSLENGVRDINAYRKRPIKYNSLTCKIIAENIGVSVSTISNLNVDSKYSLIRSVALEIIDAYEDYFMYQRNKSLKELSDSGEDIAVEYVTVGSISEVVEDLYHSSYMYH